MKKIYHNRALFYLLLIVLISTASLKKEKAPGQDCEILNETVASSSESLLETTTTSYSIENKTEKTKEDSFETTNANNFEKVVLDRVVDGDTLVVIHNGIEEKIRLIGIDTPESVHPDKTKNTEFGTLASNYTKSILTQDMNLWLQYDETQIDKYNRTLAYVWLKEDVDIMSKTDISNYMLNGILVYNGYAVDKMYKPNIKYADVFSELSEYAEENKIGLWNSDFTE